MRMFNKRITCRLLACLLFFNCLPALLFAQGTQAIITGTVVDNKGESVIGATIQVKNESTGFFTGSITNDKGEYTIKQLPYFAAVQAGTQYLPLLFPHILYRLWRTEKDRIRIEPRGYASSGFQASGGIGGDPSCRGGR